MSPKMRKVSDKPVYLDIAPRTIRFGDKTYQVKNLTFVETRKFRPIRKITNAALLGAIGIVSAGAYVTSRHESEISSCLPDSENILAQANMFHLAVIAVCTAFFAWTILHGLFERFLYRAEYSLRFETNSGSDDVLFSKKREFIDNLVALITEVMDDETPTNVYRVNVMTKNIKKVKSETVMGDKFENIRNATIINRSVVKDAIMKVATASGDEVSEALRQIAAHVDDSKDAAAASLFNAFAEELRKPTPDKSRLQQCWEGLTRVLPSVASLVDACAKMAKLFA